eukprot:349210_1
MPTNNPTTTTAEPTTNMPTSTTIHTTYMPTRTPSTTPTPPTTSHKPTHTASPTTIEPTPIPTKIPTYTPTTSTTKIPTTSTTTRGWWNTPINTDTPICMPGWTIWSPWSDCSNQCGMGIKYRIRKCIKCHDSSSSSSSDSSSSSSSSSSRTGADQAADWKYCVNCGCNCHNRRVTRMRWESVPMMSTGAEVGTNIARFVFLGLAEIGGRLQQASHDCVEFCWQCNICGESGTYVLEYGSKGRSGRFGSYSKWHKGVGETSHVDYFPSSMTLSDVIRTYNNVWHNMTGSDYTVSKNNCKAYAKAVWNHVKNHW